MSSEEFQRLIGQLVANVDTLKQRVGRLETLVLTICMGAVGLIIAIVLASAGLTVP